MSGAALALVLTAAVLHAVWNMAAKRVEGDGYAFVWWYDVFSAVLWLPIGAIVLALAGWPLTWWLLIAPLVSAVIHITYQLTLQTGYDRADLGVVYPVARGTGPLLTMVVALVVLQERPGAPAVTGGLVVIAGIVVVASGNAGASRRRARNGLAWGAATGTAIAAYTLFDDHAVTSWALLPVPYFALSSAWQVVLMAPALRRRTTAPLTAVLRRNRWEIGIVAVLSPLAYILVLEAMRTTPVSLVAPARETSIVVGALLAWWVFHEPRPLRRLLGAAVVLAGIALIVA